LDPEPKHVKIKQEETQGYVHIEVRRHALDLAMRRQGADLLEDLLDAVHLNSSLIGTQSGISERRVEDDDGR
jgi:hypothetical protein